MAAALDIAIDPRVAGDPGLAAALHGFEASSEATVVAGPEGAAPAAWVGLADTLPAGAESWSRPVEASLPEFDPRLASLFLKGRWPGIPLRLDFPLLYYRSDLLGDRREQSWFAEATGRELAVPANWGLLAVAAQHFTRPPQRYGFAFPGDAAGLLAFFRQVLASLGGAAVDPRGRPQLRSREADAAASLLFDLHVRWETTPPDTLSMDQAAVAQRFRMGEVTMALDGPRGFRRALDPSYSAVGGWLAVGPVPGAAPPRRRSQPSVLCLALRQGDEAATALAGYLLSAPGLEALCSDGGLPVTVEARRLAAAPLRVGSIAERRWALCDQAVDELPSPLSLIDLPRWEAELGGRLRRMLAGELEPRAALGEAHEALAR